jgi:non-heme chloroperoxidase
MNIITTQDGTKIISRTGVLDGRSCSRTVGRSARVAWDPQMLFLGEKGFRVIAHDCRGHGRSSQPWNGYDMDTFADDLAALLEALDLKDATLVAHSMRGGEIVRYIGRHSTKRVAKAVLIAAIPPLKLKAENNSGGLPRSAFDQIRAALVADRSQFVKDVSVPFYGYNKRDAKVSQGVRDSFWFQGMHASIKGVYDCVKAFSETDSTEDLKKIDVPTLILHGDADHIVPIGDSALISSRLVANSTLKIYPGA